METKVGKERAEELYEAWIKGAPIKSLQTEFGITRQRIYQILNNHKNISEKDKMLRAVNKFSK